MGKIAHICDCIESILNEAQQKDFEWGQWDCCLFTVKYVRDLTGVDLYNKFKGTYSDRTTMMLMVASYLPSFNPTEDFVNQIFTYELDTHFKQVQPSHIKKGDICLYQTPLGSTAGLCIGHKIAMVGEDKPIYFLPCNSNIIKAWRII